MEPHELAIAALSHRRDLSAGPSKATGPNAPTGIDSVENNNAQEPFQPSQGTETMASTNGESQEHPNNSTLGLQSTFSDNSQSTTDGHDASTPPTSTSDGFSSQSTNADGQLSQLSQLSQLAAAAQPMTNTSASRPNLSLAVTAGHKRTADGLFKSPTSPHGSKARGHSRNTSAVSTASTTSSKIGEVNKGILYTKTNTDMAQLSSELRTRLS